MKNVEEFASSMVKIDLGDGDWFGHYPYQLFSEDKDDACTATALMLGGDVAGCFSKFAEHKTSGDKRIYMSLDFPICGDMKNDFVAIFSFENNKIDVFAIPYNINNGKRLKIIKNSHILTKMKDDLIKAIKAKQE